MNLPDPETLWKTKLGVSVALPGPNGNIHMQGAQYSRRFLDVTKPMKSVFNPERRRHHLNFNISVLRVLPMYGSLTKK
ncbi:MAG: hypothetical protein ACK5PU_04595 [bacterium]